MLVEILRKSQELEFGIYPEASGLEIYLYLRISRPNTAVFYKNSAI
ncbi:Uncharacterised protein [Flavobacterium hibernum]|nr:Uncharacterised protein [Flavobacterium hibernum]